MSTQNGWIFTKVQPPVKDCEVLACDRDQPNKTETWESGSVCRNPDRFYAWQEKPVAIPPPTPTREEMDRQESDKIAAADGWNGSEARNSHYKALARGRELADAEWREKLNNILNVFYTANYNLDTLLKSLKLLAKPDAGK